MKKFLEFLFSLFRKKEHKSDVPKGWSKITHKGKTYLVSNDYYKRNGIRWPMDYPTARSIVEAYGCIMPTKELVDAIWKQADLQLQPQPMHYTTHKEMSSPEKFQEHDEMINAQLMDMGWTEDDLIAGHKKDIVRSNRFNRVAIYGWHYRDGRPIQPYSTAHGELYYDYSHGLRLIKEVT